MKLITLSLVLVFVLLFSGCNNIENGEKEASYDTTALITEYIESAKTVEDIIDNSNDRELPDVEEVFYEDDSHIYIFGNPISEYLIVKYTDGSTENVKQALEKGNIQIADIEKFGIGYFAEPKLIERIVDLAENGEIITDSALEEFYTDENYGYYFPSIRSQYIIVYFKDGSEQNVKEALAAGKLKISDLDWFGIKYYKQSIMIID